MGLRLVRMKNGRYGSQTRENEEQEYGSQAQESEEQNVGMGLRLEISAARLLCPHHLIMMTPHVPSQIELQKTRLICWNRI